MGLKYRKSIKIAPGVKLNVGKKSAGISVGGKYGGVSVNSKTGVRTRTSLPGTGISYTSSSGKKAHTNSGSSRSAKKTSSAKPPKERNPYVELVLCIFLGSMGIHRFYVGKIGTGILYLFTVGLFGIGWIVDIIMIAVRVAKGSPPRCISGDQLSPPISESQTEPPITEEVSTADTPAQDDVASARAVVCAEFQASFDNLPRADILPSDEKAPLVSAGEISFSNVTKKSNWNSLGDFVAVDVETTGLKATCSIIEIAAVRFRNWTPVESFTTLLRPTKDIPEAATLINGITNEMVEGKPHFRQIATQLVDFIGSDSIVGHNLGFDLKFICRYADLTSTKRKYYDTLAISQRTLKKVRQKWDKELECYMPDYDDCNADVDDYKLETLCRFFAIPDLTMHRAESDAFLTGVLFKHLSMLRVDKISQ